MADYWCFGHKLPPPTGRPGSDWFSTTAPWPPDFFQHHVLRRTGKLFRVELIQSGRVAGVKIETFQAVLRPARVGKSPEDAPEQILPFARQLPAVRQFQQRRQRAQPFTRLADRRAPVAVRHQRFAEFVPARDKNASRRKSISPQSPLAVKSRSASQLSC